MVMGKDVPRVEPQSGRIEPSGVYAMPQKLDISFGFFSNVLGSLGSVCAGTADGLAEAGELLVVEARLLSLFLL